MDFKLSQITVPFRMQPGLRRVAAAELRLTPLQPGSAIHAEKLHVMDLQQSRHAVPGFDAAPALAAIAAHTRLSGSGQNQEQANALARGTPLELLFEEDFAVLDGATATVPWLCVSLPSHWAPEEKLGLSLAQIHAPVADNTALLAATTGLVKLISQGGYWQRHVWTLTPSPRYDQHSHRHPRTQWAETTDIHEFAALCQLRVERQGFLPVLDVEGKLLRQAVFTIRVMLQPLCQAVRTTGDARHLHDALASMSDAVLDYKNLRPAVARLLQWLDHYAGEARLVPQP